MTKDDIKQYLEELRDGQNDVETVLTAVEAYSSASNGAKPSVSGSLPLVEILDMLNKAHEALAKSEISQDQYSPISWALVDAKKRIGVLLSGNDR